VTVGVIGVLRFMWISGMGGRGSIVNDAKELLKGISVVDVRVGGEITWEGEVQQCCGREVG
jgi:hypothetical protein